MITAILLILAILASNFIAYFWGFTDGYAEGVVEVCGKVEDILKEIEDEDRDSE